MQNPTGLLSLGERRIVGRLFLNLYPAELNPTDGFAGTDSTKKPK